MSKAPIEAPLKATSKAPIEGTLKAIAIVSASIVGVIVCIVVCIVVVGTSLRVSASVPTHHAFAAAFDENRPVNLEGVVTNVELVNPHSWIWMDVTNPDGSVTNWGLEGGPPLNLLRNGVTKNTLPVGSEIKVFGYQAKSGETKGVGVFFEYLDGRKVFMGGSAPGADGNPVPDP